MQHHQTVKVKPLVHHTAWLTRRFARVTNLNDCVTRVPTFFTDTGEPFVHADGKHTSWCAPDEL